MISSDRLDAWLRGVAPDRASRAVIAIGVRPDEVGAADADFRLGLRPPVLRWSLSDEDFRHRSRTGAAELASFVPPRVPLRLAVETSADPIEVVKRLLEDEAVESAFVVAQRPATALRRRPWRWPLRIGLVGFPEGAADEFTATIRSEHHVLPPMLEVRRIEDDPAAVDILFVEGPLMSAIEQLVRLRPVSNAVIVLDRPGDHPALIEAHLATARASTASVASAIVPPADLSQLLPDLVYEWSHAQPFDVALTTATGRDVLIWAEPDALAASAIPEIALRTADELEGIVTVGASAELRSLPDNLRSAAEGAFHLESHEATRLLELRASSALEVELKEQKRWCQAYVGVEGDNVLRHGKNPVAFFIGPLEEGAVAGPGEFDESNLPWDDEKVEAFRLTVLFIPSGEDSVVQQAELELPRVGRSRSVPFELRVPAGAESAQARILVLFRNRVLQSAMLGARVGERAALTEVVAWVPSLAGLDDRRPFDVALFANHTNGQPGLTRHSSGRTKISAAPGVAPIADDIATMLAQAASTRRSIKRGLRSPAARDLLVRLARRGHELHDELEDKLGGFAGATRIQVVSARSTWFLPLEVVYPRWAPVTEATICENYLDDPATCNGLCTPANDRTSVCPNAFWGLSKTIERHRFDVDLEQGHLLEASKRPRRGLKTISIDRALFAASERVGDEDQAATVAALGRDAEAVASWGAWEESLAASDTQLLVLLPHTNHKKFTLEIAAEPLDRSMIESTYVTGDRDVDPIVVLFGCRTAGNTGDPAGYAWRFMQKGASGVFHSSTDLRNIHATEMARRLTALMTAAGHRPQPLSDALTTFRREAVHDGLLMAFAISAFGDADWKV